MITFCIFSLLVPLHLVLLVRFISPPRQLKIQILELAFKIWFSFTCIFYGSIHIWLYTYTIDLNGDIEKNPGPKPRSSQNVPICHWNLTKLTAHSYIWTQNLLIDKLDVIFLLKKILRFQRSITWCQFENTGLRMGPIKPPITT